MSKRKKRGVPEASEGAPEWMVTYSDMVTLLLTFFIMMFSMATIDNKKFLQVAYSLRSTFMHKSDGEMFNYNTGKDIISVTPSDNGKTQEKFEFDIKTGLLSSMEDNPLNILDEIKQKKLEDVLKEIETEIENLNLGEYITIIDHHQYLILRFDSIILFDLGKAEILPSGKEILLKLGDILKKLDNGINIEGHTDNLPINTLLFPSNWELSTKRATNVVLLMVEQSKLNPSKLVASGRGEFKPIRPNNSEENRSKNRRIDIIIEK